MTDTALELVATPMAPANLFGSNNPQETVARASEIASALTDVIQKKKLFKNIGDKSYVYVQGWTLLGSMLGVFPVVVWTRPLEEGGFEARVEARTLSGQIVGAAESQCSRNEPMWSHAPVNKWGKKLEPRPDNALRSMAQTRARSKALQGPLDFIVTLAGYQGTPAEEMEHEDLTEPLKASIAMVQAKKAAAKPGDGVPRKPDGRIDVGAAMAQAAHTHYRMQDEARAAAEGPLIPDRDWVAPPLCPACKSPVGQFASESKAHLGRKFWQCQRANDRVLELEEREPKLTYAQIYADKQVKDHWRSWAEPWPRKADPAHPGEPKEGRN